MRWARRSRGHAWVATHANFTYTLHSPSGLGEDCVSDGTQYGAGAAQYAAQYNCGVNDVVDLNRTDMYWAMYFVTVPRQRKAIFTQPFVSDVGLIVACPKEDPTWWSEATKIFAPFSPALWVVTLSTTLFVCLIMWLTNSQA